MTRHLLCRILLCGLAACVLSALPGHVWAADEPITVTHGPILGRPKAHEMGVWARTSQPGTFRVRYGIQADRLEKTSDPATTRLEADTTGWILLTGLEANTRYHYQVVPAGAKDGPGGSFRTLPDAAAFRNERHNPRGLFNLRFEVGCCANQGPYSLGADLPAYQSKLAQFREKVYFSIHNGDFIYEEKRNFSPEQWLAQVKRPRDELPLQVKLAPTITGVWENYKLYLERGKNLAAWHRAVPCYFTFDDHEILNDIVGTGTPGFRHRRTVFRDIGVQAWYDYVGWANPIDFRQGILFGRAKLKAGSEVLIDAGADFTKLDLKQATNLHVHWGTPDAGVNDEKLDDKDGDPNAAVYEIVEVVDKNRLRIRPAAKQDGDVTYSIGRRSYFQTRVGNCAFFFLDTRSQRDKHDIKDPAKPGVSMLGKRQKEWLLDAMGKCDADFLFVVSSVNFMIPHSGAGGMSAQADDKDDAWTAFVDEREQLLKSWEKLGKPVVIFTGDLHNSWAIRITDRIWEFAAGPLNSANHPLDSEGGRPPTGRYNSRGRPCDIRWSTFFLDDVPRELRRRPVYCIVQVNNVFNNPLKPGEDRWVAYPQPQVVFAFHDGRTGELLYAESVQAAK